MKKTMKKLVLLAALALLICLPLCALGDSDHVAKIGNTPYTTLGEAITAANSAESGATITLLSDVSISAAYEIKKPVTITGPYTLKRAHTGSMFIVNSGGVLTLDGGMTIDCGSKKTFDRNGFYADMATYTFPEDGLGDEDPHYIIQPDSSEGDIDSKAFLVKIENGGKATVKSCTIRNNYCCRGRYTLFDVPAGAELTLAKGAHITENTTIEADGLIYVHGGTANILDGVLIDYNHFQGGLGGIFKIYGDNSVVNMSGGTICKNTGLSSNSDASGIAFSLQGHDSVGGDSWLKISGGTLCHNAGFGDGGGLGAVIYIHDSCTGGFEMTGGEIVANENYLCTTISGNSGGSGTPAQLNLLGGLISQKASGKGNYSGFTTENMVIGENMKLEGDVFWLYSWNKGQKYNYEIDGTVDSTLSIRNGDVTMKGTGTVNGDVTISSGTKVNLTETTWTGDVTIQGGKLTVGSGATMTGNITLESGSELNINEGANLSGCTITSNGKQNRIPQGCVQLVPVTEIQNYGYGRATIGNETVFVPSSTLLSIDADGHVTPLSGEGVLKDNNGDDLPDIAILSGENSAYAAGGSLPVIVCSGFLDSFNGVSVAPASGSGKALTASDFTAERGSTVLTLSESYLNTLPLGDYTVTLQYLDGQSVSAALTVQAPAPGAGDLPHTGDHSRLALWALMLLATIPFLARRARRARRA